MLQTRDRIKSKGRRAPCWLPALAAGLMLAGCSTLEKDPTADWTAEQLYADAKADLDAGNWSSAIKGMERLESRYPFGSYAQQAQLDIAWAYYKEGERGEALAAINRFIRLHPAHERLDYAYYLKGLINFTSREGLISRWAGQDSSERDLQASRESYDAFQQLVNRFPTSRYRADALDRMRALVNSMASGEVHVARYYLSRGAYVASANRAQGVLSQYPNTPAVEEALNILATSYDQLQLHELRDDAVRVLARTFPQSTYLAAFPTPAEPDGSQPRPSEANNQRTLDMPSSLSAPVIPSQSDSDISTGGGSDAGGGSGPIAPDAGMGGGIGGM